mgnify:CR=1 FL=1|tara:strand:+ start:2874 stop:3590 length:717 start_codon:yes stop_codon:yes gene_type:complete
MTHCGGRIVDFNEIQSVPLPEQTDTYIPVPFEDLVSNTRNIADDLLKGYTFNKDQYALSGGKNKDQRMFAVLQYQAEDSEMGYALGIRSSYDKSMSNGFCAGAQIFVCDNLAFSGSITYMRKHTKNVWDDLKEKIVTSVYNSQRDFKNIIEDKHVLENTPINNYEAGSFLGRLFNKGTIKPRQIAEADRQWKKPNHVEFTYRNAWSLYNACTEALKTTTPDKILEKHISLHNDAMALC